MLLFLLCSLITFFEDFYFFMCMYVFAICVQSRGGQKGELKSHICEPGDNLLWEQQSISLAIR